MKIWKTDDRWLSENYRVDGIATIPMPIKRKWFDMIKSGEKKEEYRSLRWEKRIIRHCKKCEDIGMMNEICNISIHQECLRND